MLPEHVSYRQWLTRQFPESETTIHYPNDLKLLHTWAGKPLERWEVKDVDAYVDHALYTAHHKPTSIKRRLAALRSFWTFLETTSSHAPSCPLIPRRHKIKVAQRLPRDVEDAVVLKLFGIVKRQRDRAMFLLMYLCGLRLGEVRNLRLGGLFLSPLSAASLPRLQLIGKGNKERSVFIDEPALGALRLWLAQRPAVNNEFVFLTRTGTPYNVTNIRALLARYCVKAGVRFTCHQLRHAFARLLAERGVPLSTLQTLLGHKYMETTRQYLTVHDRHVMQHYKAAIARVCEQLPLQAKL